MCFPKRSVSAKARHYPFYSMLAASMMAVMTIMTMMLLLLLLVVEELLVKYAVVRSGNHARWNRDSRNPCRRSIYRFWHTSQVSHLKTLKSMPDLLIQNPINQGRWWFYSLGCWHGKVFGMEAATRSQQKNGCGGNTVQVRFLHSQLTCQPILDTSWAWKLPGRKKYRLLIQSGSL